MWRLIKRGMGHGPFTEAIPPDPTVAELAARLQQAGKARLGRSLTIRAVDAGSCNGCELEIHALNNPIYDVERFGIHFAASPRHADILLVTGPVTVNMAEALHRTWEATPAPKWVIACGQCAVNGGVFAKSYACYPSVSEIIPVDVELPGCPPTPMEMLHALLALLDANSGTMAIK